MREHFRPIVALTGKMLPTTDTQAVINVQVHQQKLNLIIN